MMRTLGENLAWLLHSIEAAGPPGCRLRRMSPASPPTLSVTAMEGRFDEFSYRCGVIDSFCEMVAAGNKPLALSHPFRDGADRARYLPHCRAMAEQYGILFRRRTPCR